MKSRVRYYYNGWGAKSPRNTGLVAHSRTPCSCFMCGNPRRWWREVSLQERRLLAEDLEAAS
jgi:hypothetical protein